MKGGRDFCTRFGPGHAAPVAVDVATVATTKGDTLFLTEAPGGFRLTPYDPTFERQMKMAREIMKTDRNMLRELANR